VSPTSFTLAIVSSTGHQFPHAPEHLYVVDVYRRQQRAIENPLDYALFICFFPQLVAGPIVRARVFFRDLYNWRAPSSGGSHGGHSDDCPRPGEEDGVRRPVRPGVGFVLQRFCRASRNAHRLERRIAFTLQIYFDFSGYTDIAIGSAKLLGFNFRPISTGRFWPRASPNSGAGGTFPSPRGFATTSIFLWLRPPWRTGHLRHLLITMTWAGCGTAPVGTSSSGDSTMGALLSVERIWRVCAENGRRRKRGGSARAPRDPHFLPVCAGAPFFRLHAFRDAFFVSGICSAASGELLFNSGKLAWRCSP